MSMRKSPLSNGVEEVNLVSALSVTRILSSDFSVSLQCYISFAITMRFLRELRLVSASAIQIRWNVLGR